MMAYTSGPPARTSWTAAKVTFEQRDGESVVLAQVGGEEQVCESHQAPAGGLGNGKQTAIVTAHTGRYFLESFSVGAYRLECLFMSLVIAMLVLIAMEYNKLSLKPAFPQPVVRFPHQFMSSVHGALNTPPLAQQQHHHAVPMQSPFLVKEEVVNSPYLPFHPAYQAAWNPGLKADERPHPVSEENFQSQGRPVKDTAFQPYPMTSDGTSQTPSPVTSNVPKSNNQILGGRKYLDECMNLLKGSTRTCVHGRECLSCQECCSSLAAMVAKPFECPECPRAFSSTAALQTHVQSHGADRPYSCTECPKAFTQLSALQVRGQSESGYPTRVRHPFERAIKLSYVTKEQYCFNPFSPHHRPTSHCDSHCRDFLMFHRDSHCRDILLFHRE
uniref:C2H2-type domain-containing protein n=1 Tax=Timema shepardi TaxID=629360 RepID=A0A7R9FX55_TIMSH|nr:unnamed protein product [Timema shepardi]